MTPMWQPSRNKNPHKVVTPHGDGLWGEPQKSKKKTLISVVGYHAYKRLFILSIFCSECTYAICVECDVVFFVNIVGVGAHLLAVKAYGHVHPIVVIIVVAVAKIMWLPAAQYAVLFVFPFPATHFHFAICIETDECAAGREDNASAVVAFVTQNIVIIKSPLLAFGRNGYVLLHDEQINPLLAITYIGLVGVQPYL